MKTTRVVLIVAGVVALAAVAKRWFMPGDVYILGIEEDESGRPAPDAPRAG